MILTILSILSTTKPLTPHDYPHPPGGTKQPWQYDPNLQYSRDWVDRGACQFHPLSSQYPDYMFVQQLYAKSPVPDHTIAEVILMSNETDEQAFQAGVDLLQKKHGSTVHKPKWKTMDQVTQRQTIRQQLKVHRYRSQAAENVKLLPLWHGTSVDALQTRSMFGFGDLTKTSDEMLGKGYYGCDRAEHAFSAARIQQISNPILMLSWYAGKVVYPVLQGDVNLQGQPHYSNHDLHYAVTHDNGHKVAVFDIAQVLTRYLVTLQTQMQVSTCASLVRQLSCYGADQSALLFQQDFSYITSLLCAHNRLDIDWKQGADVDGVLRNFTQDHSFEVLLYRTDCREVLTHYLEKSLWDKHQNGQNIPLYVDLRRFKNPQKQLIEQVLSEKGLTREAISDLKTHARFTFILDHYEDQTTTLLKSNHLNSPGGFKGKVIIIAERELNDLLCYTEGGTIGQQSERVLKHFIKKYAEPEILAPKLVDNYVYAGRQHKPWNYDNKLRYSPCWIDKGAYRLHLLQPGDSDYEFVNTLYQRTRMPGHELDQVYLVSDRSAEQAFIANLALLNRRHHNPEYQPQWQHENNPDFRGEVLAHLMSLDYPTALIPHVKLLPLWHGTGPDAAGGIARSGFASLASEDDGYFGKGIYGSNSAEYAYSEYAYGRHADHGLLMLSWYATQNAYPVIEGDKAKLQAQANYQNCDSHFIPVDGVNFFPINTGQKPTYHELVTFQTAQVLPRYIISLKETQAPAGSPGMVQLLNASRIDPQPRSDLYQKNLNTIMADLKHSAQTEREQDFMVTQGLSIYIPSQAADRDHTDDSKLIYPLMDKAQKFLDDPQKEVWILQGNSGAGKSLFGRFLEQTIWAANSDLIPLFISLPRLQDMTQDPVEHILQLKGIPTENIAELKANKRFVFIFDGYDEIPGKPEITSHYHFNEPNGWQGKLIICSRTQYLNTNDNRLLYPQHPNEDLYQRAQHCMESYIVPFTPEQIDRYIDGFCNSAFNQVQWAKQRYQETLEQFSEIKEFLQEPFLLFLTLNALPELQTSHEGKARRIDLYQAFTKSWFNKQFERLIQHHCDFTGYQNPKDDILTVFKYYAQDLACEMLRQNIQTIRRPNALKRFFEDTKEIQLGFQGSPLKRVGEEYFFIHKSFQEYFVAQTFLDEYQYLQSKDVTAKNIQPLMLNQLNLLQEPAIQYFIADRIQQDIQLQELLFNVILASREHPEIKIASASVATCLNTAGISFSGRNLSGVQLPGADLSQGFFDAINFQHTDLSNVNFSGSHLNNADFSYSRMHGVNFGEYVYLEFPNTVYCCCYSKDRRFIIVASGNDIVLHDGKTHEYIKTFFGHVDIVNSISFNPKGDKIVSGSNDKTVKLWNCISTQCEKTFEEHTDDVVRVCFCPNGSKCVSGDRTTALRLWDVDTGICLKALNGHGFFCDICFDPQGNRCLFVDEKIYFWNCVSGQCEQEITNPNENCVLACAFSPFGDKFIVCGENNGHLYDTNSGEYEKTLRCNDVVLYSVCFNHSGEKCLIGGERKVYLFNIDSGKCEQTFSGHKGPSWSVCFDLSENTIMVGCGDAAHREKTVRFWDIAYDQCKPFHGGHTNSVLSISLNSQGNKCISGSSDRTICLWDLVSCQCEQTFYGHTSDVNSVFFGPLDRVCLSGSKDNTVRLWDIISGKCKQIFEEHTNSIKNVWFNQFGTKCLSCTEDGMLHLWDIASGECEQVSHKHPSTSGNICFNPTENKYLLSSNSTICLYDLISGQCLQTFLGHTDSILSMCFSRIENKFLSGSADKTLRIWDLTSARCLQTFLGHKASILAVSFNPIGNKCLSGSADKTLRIWDCISSKQLLMQDTESRVFSVCWSSDNYIISGHADSSIRYWCLVESNYELSLQLIWVNPRTKLALKHVCFHEVQELSLNNTALLEQRISADVSYSGAPNAREQNTQCSSLNL